jgi:hypothetical protein
MRSHVGTSLDLKDRKAVRDYYVAGEAFIWVRAAGECFCEQTPTCPPIAHNRRIG